jgi:hypothetical protein
MALVGRGGATKVDLAHNPRCWCTKMTSTMAIEKGFSMAGTLKNMLATGFSTENCITELIDDSLGAGATHVRLTLADGRCLITADNGSGMTRKNTQTAHVLNNRSAASAVKHGRFGIGRKYALVVLSELQARVRTLTRTADGTTSQLDIDFPTVVREDKMILYAHGFEADAYRNEWLPYAIRPNESGTISLIPLTESKAAELYDLFTAKTVKHSLLYRLSLIYHRFLASGGSIELVINGVTHKAMPVNPVAGAMTEDTLTLELSVFRLPSGSEIRSYYMTNGKTVRYYKNPETGRLKEFSETAPEGWEQLGTVTVRAAYAADWLSLQTPTLEGLGLELVQGDVEGVQSQREELGGSFFLRNGRVIQRHAPMKAKSGDKARYPFVEQSRYTVDFQPVVVDAPNDDTFTMDNVLGVQVNKSRIDETLIDPAIQDPLNKFMSHFASEMYKKYKVPLTGSSVAPLSLQPSLVTSMQEPADLPAAAASPSSPAPAPVPAPPPVKPVVKVHRAATTAVVPVSERCVVDALEGFATFLSTVDFEKWKNAASGNMCPGAANQVAAITGLIEFVTEHNS